MARIFCPKIVTANDLLEGDVVYFTGAGDWSRNHTDAHPCLSKSEADELLIRAEKYQEKVVGAYLADVEISPTREVVLQHFREIFRAKGPSNYFHGKQAEG